MGFLSGLLGGGLFGGGGSSFSSGGIANKESTTNQSTSNVYTDNRQVNDAGGGIIGSGNVQTVVNNTTDGGAFKLMTDVGLAQTAAVVDLAKLSQDTARFSIDRATRAALDAQENALATVNVNNSKAFDMVRSSAAESYKSSAQAIGFASDSFESLARMSGDLVRSAQKQADNAATTAQQAYQSAADQSSGNRTLILTAIAVVAVVAGLPLLLKLTKG